MDDQPGLSDQYRMASPWPLFVALGLAISEVGVLLNLVPLSVGGLLLFTGSVAGIVQEAGYVERPWDVLGGLGLALAVVGGLLVIGQANPFTLDRLLALVGGVFGPQPNGMVVRGLSILAAGLVALIGSVVAILAERGRVAADAI